MNTQNMNFKRILYTRKTEHSHWVGDGFPVRTIFSYNDIAADTSPFLLMDYAGPAHFSPTELRRGVGSHPHRGFETVTVIYQGQVEHRDSAGGGGVIQAGDVQWMTAGSGLVHEERHGQDFANTGGPFEMVQLWVNLPKKDKMTNPRYQAIGSKQIPKIELMDGCVILRIIAGEYGNIQGPAKTFSSINLWDLRIKAKANMNLAVPIGHTAQIFVLSGEIKVSDTHILNEAEMAVLALDGDNISIECLKDAKILFMGGQPLNEPIVGYGPFVMNTKAEIHQAIKDFEEGKMGVIQIRQ